MAELSKISPRSKYTHEMPATLLAMMTLGKSTVQFSASVHICRDTFYDWLAKYPEFAQAYKEGKQKCESFWETWLHANLANKDLNSNLIKLFFANRFDWHDRKETKNETTVTIKTHEEALKDLQ